jgi:hypothetical protein
MSRTAHSVRSSYPLSEKCRLTFAVTFFISLFVIRHQHSTFSEFSGLAFTCQALQNMQNDTYSELHACFKRSYDAVLRHHHTFVIRSVVSVRVTISFRSGPSSSPRTRFLSYHYVFHRSSIMGRRAYSLMR